MPFRFHGFIHPILLVALLAVPVFGTPGRASWNGILRDAAGNVVADASLELRPSSGGSVYSARTSATGVFAFTEIAAGKYQLSVSTGSATFKSIAAIDVKDGAPLTAGLKLSSPERLLVAMTEDTAPSPQAKFPACR